MSKFTRLMELDFTICELPPWRDIDENVSTETMMRDIL